MHNEERQNKSGRLSPDSSHLEIRIPSHASVLPVLFAIIVTVSIPDLLYSLRNQLIPTKSARPGLLSSLIVLQYVATDHVFLATLI